MAMEMAGAKRGREMFQGKRQCVVKRIKINPDFIDPDYCAVCFIVSVTLACILIHTIAKLGLPRHRLGLDLRAATPAFPGDVPAHRSSDGARRRHSPQPYVVLVHYNAAIPEVEQ